MERIEPLLPAPDTTPPAQMLLVHRANPVRFIVSPRLHADWAPAVTRLVRLTVRSVVHTDCCRPEAIRAFSESFAAFASNPDRPCASEPQRVGA